jgi:phenylalanyl-tRNA synthetase alpha chain
MSSSSLPAPVAAALSKRDLSDPALGPHAVGLVVDNVRAAMARLWGGEPAVVRPSPVVRVADNYDRLHYPPDAAARSPRYARYIDAATMLRTHTTAAVPAWLDGLDRGADDHTVMIPGMVWRRDCVDRRHVGEPHQLDIWRVVRGRRMARGDLMDMVGAAVGAILPGARWRANETEHHYTVGGLEVEVLVDGRWLEMLECGLAAPRLLGEAGLDPARWSGLAMGIGLDRAVMIAKGLDDIRLLRAADPRVARQMLDLAPWRPVSRHQGSTRDLSVARDAGLTDEELGDLLRDALGGDAELVEEAAIIGRWAASELPAAARARLGAGDGQENLLVRVTVRSTDGPVDKGTCARLYAAAYAALHRGGASGYA